MITFCWILFCIVLWSGCQTAVEEDPEPRPNILFVITDDQTYQAVHALGNDAIETPWLDQLVAGGTTFSHTYNMGGWNGAICTASRSMLISGRSLWRANAFRQHWIEGNNFDQSWGRIMSDQGYQTFMTGKWHVDAPADSIFQTVKHVRPGMPPDAWGESNMPQRFKDLAMDRYASIDEIMPVGYNRPIGPNDHSWSATDSSFGGFWDGGQHWSEVVADDAISFLLEATLQPDPFFIYVAFNAPHDPRQSPQPYLDKYPLEEIHAPVNWLPEHPLKDSMGCGPRLRDEALAPFPRHEYAIRTHRREYYALVTHLDHQIGRILQSLESTGKADNTYIFLTSDHGLAVGQHGLMGKQNMYDHSIRVPMMICGPAIPANTVIHTQVYLQDIMPTTLDLAGITIPDYVDFHSLLPIIRGERKRSHYPAIYGAYMATQRMIRKNNMKLIDYPRADTIELFDLSQDPWEMNELSQDSTYQDLKQQLQSELKGLQEQYADPLVHQPAPTL